MAEDKNKEVAGFLKGNINPEDLEREETPKEEKKSPPVESSASSGGISFLGGASAAPEPSGSDEKAEEVASAKESSSPQSTSEPSNNVEAESGEGEDYEVYKFDSDSEEVVSLHESGEVKGVVLDVEPEYAAAESSEAEDTPVEELQPLPDPSASAAEFFQRADELSEQGYYSSAITAYRKGLDKSPGDVLAINNLAMIFIEQEKLDEARIELEQAVSLGAENAEIYNNLGYVLRKMGNDIGAADAYEKYLEINPDVEAADKIRGWIDEVRSMLDSLKEEEAASGVQTQPLPASRSLTEEEQNALNRAWALYDAGNFQGAISGFNDFLVQIPDNADALEGKGKAQIKLELYEEGIASLREAEMLGLSSPELYYVMGFAYRAMGRDSEAADAYEKFLSKDPNAENSDKIRQWIAEVRQAAESTVEAQPEESADNGLKIDKQPAWASALDEPEYDVDPLDVGGEEGGGEISLSADSDAPAEGGTLEDAADKLEEGDVDAALKIAQDFSANDPDNIEARLLVARCFGRKEEFSKALPLLKGIVELIDTRTDAWFLLGRCQQMLDNKNEAIACYRKVAELDADGKFGPKATSLITELRGIKDKAMCSHCMQSVPVASLEDVGGQPVCSDCRDAYEKSKGGAKVLASEEKQVRKARVESTDTQHMRRAKKKKKSIVKVLFLLVALAVFGSVAGMIALKAMKPDLYKKFFGGEIVVDENENVFGDVDLPDEGDNVDDGLTGAKAVDAVPEVEEKKSPAEIVKIESSPASAVMAGFTYKYSLKCDPVNLLDGATFSQKWLSGVPKGESIIVPEKGHFTWKPAVEDSGKKYRLRFAVEWEDVPEGKPSAVEQIVEIKVLPLPVITDTGESLDFNPGRLLVNASGNIFGSKADEAVFITSSLDKSEINVLSVEDGGEVDLTAKCKVNGKVTGAIVSGKEIILANWNRSSLDSLSVSDGDFVVNWQMPLESRPLLIAGGADKKLMVVHYENHMTTVYALSAGKRPEVLRTIKSPVSVVASGLACVDIIKGNGVSNGKEIIFTSLSRKRPNTWMLGKGEDGWKPLSVGNGLVPFIFSSEESVAFITAAKYFSLEKLGNQKAATPFAELSLRVESPVASGVYVDFDNDGYKSVILLSPKGGIMQRQDENGFSDKVVGMALPEGFVCPSSLVAVCKNSTGEGKVVFADRTGKIAIINMKEGK